MHSLQQKAWNWLRVGGIRIWIFKTAYAEGLKGVQKMTASANLSMPAPVMKQPTRVDGYMIVARDLLQGVEELSALPPTVSPRSCALLAAHALECALKAFLAHSGKEKKVLESRKVGHNLVLLWNMAYEEKHLGIPKVPPVWVTILSAGHGPEFGTEKNSAKGGFYFRYQEGERGTIVHGGQTPSLIPMVAELKGLIEGVGQAVRG